MSRTSRYLAFISVVLGFFMATLDSTVVTVTLPTMTAYFDTNIRTISWVINSYNIAFAVLLITASRLADQFGRRRVFVLGLVLFSVTSLACGLSTTVEQLIVFRVLQGLSAALVVPVSMPVIMGLFPPERAGFVVGLWGAIAAVAAASGPALGGIIAELARWQWIFFINVPIGVLTVVMTLALVRESRDPTASRSIDWLGIITLTIAALALTLALTQANQEGWGSLYILSLFAMAVLGTAAFVVVESNVPEPMLPLRLMHSVYFSTGMLALVVVGMAIMAGAFFLAFFLTTVLEMSQLRAGLTITAMPVSAMVFAMISGPVSDKVGGRWFSVVGMTVVIVSVWMFGQLTEQSTLTDVLVRLGLIGCGLGLCLPCIVSASIRSVPPEKVGIGSGVGNMARIVGMVFGVALQVMFLTNFADGLIDEAKVSAAELVAGDEVLRPDVKDAFAQRLKAVEFSEESRLPSKGDVIAKLEQQRDERLAQSKSETSRAIMRKVYDKQLERVAQIVPQVSTLFRQKLVEGFARTFRLMAYICAIGIVLAYLCESPRLPRRSDAVTVIH